VNTIWELILYDPVAWGSILGIIIMVSMGAYYVYLFIHNAKKKLKILKHHLTQLVNKAAPWKKAGYRLVA
jgi:putative Mn2+ efflux pump MntP